MPDLTLRSTAPGGGGCLPVVTKSAGRTIVIICRPSLEFFFEADRATPAVENRFSETTASPVKAIQD
jgi:hypothetical protein